MMQMIETLTDICQEWNVKAGNAKNVDPGLYDKLLNRLGSVDPISLKHRKPPAEHVRGVTNTGQTVHILSNGQKLCTCEDFKYRRNTCKHICVIAAHALHHYYCRGSKW